MSTQPIANAAPAPPSTPPAPPTPPQPTPQDERSVAAAIGGGAVTLRYFTREGFDATIQVALTDGRVALRVATMLAERIAALGGRPVPAIGAPVAGASGDAQGAPVCAIHGRPMERRQGRNGSFWSCPEKLADGQWCPYRPK